MHRPKVVVTGGAGFIGSHICKELHRNGFTPITVDNLSYGHLEAVKWGPLEKGDIADRVFLNQVMVQHQPVSVIHCAALLDVGESTRQPDRYYRNNVAGTIILLEALLENKIGSIIFSSTCAVYGHANTLPITEQTPHHPLSPYGRSKWMQEQIIADLHQAYGLKYAFLRYFNAAGADSDNEIGESRHPHTHLIPLAMEAASGIRPFLSLFGDDYPTPDGTCVRDYIHVTDLADAHVKALAYLLNEGPNLVLNLGSGRGYSVKEVIQAVEQVSGVQIPIKIAPRRAGDPATLYADNTQARQLLGWEPHFSDLKTIVETNWAWHQKSHSSSRQKHASPILSLNLL